MKFFKTISPYVTVLYSFCFLTPTSYTFFCRLYANFSEKKKSSWNFVVSLLFWFKRAVNGVPLSWLFPLKIIPIQKKSTIFLQLKSVNLALIYAIFCLMLSSNSYIKHWNFKMLQFMLSAIACGELVSGLFFPYSLCDTNCLRGVFWHREIFFCTISFAHCPSVVLLTS